MVRIRLNTGQAIQAPDGLEREQYDTIVRDAYSRIGTPAPAAPVAAPASAPIPQEPGFMDQAKAGLASGVQALAGVNASARDFLGTAGEKTKEVLGLAGPTPEGTSIPMEFARNLNKGIVDLGVGFPAQALSAVLGAPEEIKGFVQKPETILPAAGEVAVETGKMLAAPLNPMEYTAEKLLQDPAGRAMLLAQLFGYGAAAKGLTAAPAAGFPKWAEGVAAEQAASKAATQAGAEANVARMAAGPEVPLLPEAPPMGSPQRPFIPPAPEGTLPLGPPSLPQNVLPEISPQAAARFAPQEAPGLLQRFNEALGEQGAVGGGGAKTAEMRAIFQDYAKKTGKSFDDILQEWAADPEAFQKAAAALVKPVQVAGEKGQAETVAGVAPPKFALSPDIPKSFNMPAESTLVERNRVASQAAESEVARLKEQLDAADLSRVDRKTYQKELDKMTESLYRQSRAAAGLDDTSTQAMGTTYSNFRDTINAANDVDKNLGVEAGGYIQKVIDAGFQKSHTMKQLDTLGDIPTVQKRLTKLRVSPEKLTDYMEHVESMPDGTVRWNPAADADQKIPAFQGEPPSPEIFAELTKLRQAYDQMHEMAGKEKKDLGYTTRYVHRASKIPGAVGGGGEKGIYDPAILRERSYEDVPMERNFWKLTERYKSQLARTKSFSDALEMGQQVDFQLRALGKGSVADKLKTVTGRALGLGDASAMDRFTAGQLKGKSVAELEKLSKDLGLTPSATKRFMREAQEQVYHAWIGVNPKNLIANLIQPELTGIAEVGPLNLWMKRIPKLMANKADVAALEAVTSRLRAAEYNPLELMEPATPTTKAGQLLSSGLKAGGKPGLKLQDIVDTSNRQAVFLAGRRQFLHAKNVKQVIGDMLPSEQQAVMDALKSGGPEAAAREYGVLRSQRVMHRFSSVNKPYVLQNELGENVPFTTFSRGEMNKLRDDLKNGNFKMAAKRVGYPLMISLALKGAGQDELAAYTNPQMAIPNLAKARPIPGIASAIEGVQKGGLPGMIKALPQFFGTTRAIDKASEFITGEKAFSSKKKKKKSSGGLGGGSGGGL